MIDLDCVAEEGARTVGMSNTAAWRRRGRQSPILRNPQAAFSSSRMNRAFNLQIEALDMSGERQRMCALVVEGRSLGARPFERSMVLVLVIRPREGDPGASPSSARPCSLGWIFAPRCPSGLRLPICLRPSRLELAQRRRGRRLLFAQTGDLALCLLFPVPQPVA
jgi:hypothetical protein